MYPNMFSEMRHHPSTSFALKPINDPPEWVDRNFRPENKLQAGKARENWLMDHSQGSGALVRDVLACRLPAASMVITIMQGSQKCICSCGVFAASAFAFPFKLLNNKEKARMLPPPSAPSLIACRSPHPPRLPADLTFRSNPRTMLGGRQPLFIRRPLNAGILPAVPICQLAPAPAPRQPSAPRQPEPAPVDVGVTRDFGTQSDYRENEAQTLPWECPYTLPAPPSLKQQVQSERFNCEGPELLELTKMQFGLDHLPAGKEVALIEKLRAKRAEYAALPKPGESGYMKAKAAYIKKGELEVWAEREDELQYQQVRTTVGWGQQRPNAHHCCC